MRKQQSSSQNTRAEPITSVIQHAKRVLTRIRRNMQANSARAVAYAEVKVERGDNAWVCSQNTARFVEIK